MLLFHKDGREEVPDNCEAIEGCPAENIGSQDAHQYHNSFPSAPKPLSDLFCLKSWDGFKPKLLRDPGIAQGHGDHRCYKFNAKDEEEV